MATNEDDYKQLQRWHTHGYTWLNNIMAGQQSCLNGKYSSQLQPSKYGKSEYFNYLLIFKARNDKYSMMKNIGEVTKCVAST